MSWDFRRELDREGPGRRQSPPPTEEIRSYCARLARYPAARGSRAFIWRLSRQGAKLAPFLAFDHWCRGMTDEFSGALGLRMLRWWRNEWERALIGRPYHPVMAAMRNLNPDTVARLDAPVRQLIFACEQDVLVLSHPTRSAWVEHLQQVSAAQARMVAYPWRAYPDGCTAGIEELLLGVHQLDILCSLNAEHALGRNRFSREDRERFGYSFADWRNQRVTPGFVELARSLLGDAEDHLYRAWRYSHEWPWQVRVHLRQLALASWMRLRKARRHVTLLWSHPPRLTRWERLALLMAEIRDRFQGPCAEQPAHAGRLPEQTSQAPAWVSRSVHRLAA